MIHISGYLWLIELTATVGVAASTAVVLHAGAISAGVARRHAALLAGAVVVLLGAWSAGTALIAARGGYHARLGHGVPWLPIAILGATATLLGLSRIPLVARALAAPGMLPRLMLPHSFRVAGVAFLLAMASGELPAVFALPAGLGDIATGVAAPLVARRLATGAGHRAARRFNAGGMTDLLVALTLGALTAFHLLPVSPRGDAISELPLVLIPTAVVPLLLVLHLTSARALRRGSASPADAPPAAGLRTAA